jgi:hypothetical protein
MEAATRCDREMERIVQGSSGDAQSRTLWRRRCRTSRLITNAVITAIPKNNGKEIIRPRRVSQQIDIARA